MHGPGPWLPAPAPAAIRELRLGVAGLVPGACLAFARKDDLGLHSLNEFTVNTKRALPLVVAHPPAAQPSDTRTIYDREAPESKFTHRVAQADWFGRWSTWATIDVPAAARPLPPAPVLEPKYTIATYTDPPPAGPLWGQLSVRVPIPPVSDLAPGAYFLQTLRLTGTVAGIAFTQDTAIPVGVDHVTAILAGPAGKLMPCTEDVAFITGRFIDAAGFQGAPSAERKVKLLDPRPPPAVFIDPALKYSARPDVTGRARVTLTWPVQAGQKRFRVYAVDETRLLAIAQGKPGAAAFFTQYNAATTPALRGLAFTDHANLFVRDWFENLTGEPLTIPAGATSMRFQHVVSGSLRVLMLYRVVALSELNVETPWSQTSLVPFGVPNSGPPPQPMLEVIAPATIDPPLAPGVVRLRVRVIRGSMPATRYRLRRSNATSADALRMLVVAEGPIVWDTVDDEPPNFHIDDAGAIPGAPTTPLRPWTRYSWRVEVQAPAEPGSTIPGEWSTASAPVNTSIILPPPIAADNLAVSQVGADKKVAWHHAEALQGGGMGGYCFEVYRRLPGESLERLLATVAVDAPAAEGGRSPTNTFFYLDQTGLAVSQTSYRVVARDPLGRRSPPTDPVSVP